MTTFLFCTYSYRSIIALLQIRLADFQTIYRTFCSNLFIEIIHWMKQAMERFDWSPSWAFQGFVDALGLVVCTLVIAIGGSGRRICVAASSIGWKRSPEIVCIARKSYHKHYTVYSIIHYRTLFIELCFYVVSDFMRKKRSNLCQRLVCCLLSFWVHNVLRKFQCNEILRIFDVRTQTWCFQTWNESSQKLSVSIRHVSAINNEVFSE